jgi:hypothetical protein
MNEKREEEKEKNGQKGEDTRDEGLRNVVGKGKEMEVWWLINRGFRLRDGVAVGWPTHVFVGCGLKRLFEEGAVTRQRSKCLVPKRKVGVG